MNNQKNFVDVGSSTIKAYTCNNTQVELSVQRSIPFKNDFCPDAGISDLNKKELFEFFDALIEQNKEAKIKIYATGIFRKMTLPSKKKLIDEFFLRNGLFFNIIDHELESFYLETALIGKCILSEPILLINIGGSSTELIVMYGKEAVERVNIDFGVDTILSKYPNINEEISGTALKEIVDYVKTILPDLKNNAKLSFYTGGELKYMRLTGYGLKNNNLFSDDDHPNLIISKDFFEYNEKVFNEIKLQELKNLMPENPNWMCGARGCSAIVQSIIEKYGIETIIPSDSNLINGAARQEFRYVTLSGSFRKHLDYILKIKAKLESSGAKILSPRFTEPKNPKETFVIFNGEEGLTPLELERHRLNSIEKSDTLIVCDPEGYVGASALIEIGYANSLGKRIVFMEKPEEFMLNTLPAEIEI